MRLTLWDHPAAAFLASALDATPYAGDTEVEYVPADEAMDRLLNEETDVALVHTLEALKKSDSVDVIPAVALSTWRYPFARITLKNGLDQAPEKVSYDPRFEQESVIARIVLKEHYRMMPEFAEDEGEEDGDRLIVSTELPRKQDALVLDLGQEWFELSGYPMIWGVFAARKGEVDEALIRRIRGIIRTAEDRKGLWLRAHEQTPEMHDFYTEQLRVRFDDLAIAGLTEFRQYLFYFGILDDVKELPVVFIPDEEDDEDAGPKPLL